MFKYLILWISLSLSFGLLNSSVLNELELTVDEHDVIGRLENGLTYYIRQNATPSNFAELRLVVNIGSVDEEDDQKGVAHFIEHMAFNGTENFPGDSLLVYMDSIGLGFRHGLRAFTTQTSTVYQLQSRTDDETQLDNAFLILSDWASRLSFDDEAIEKERSVLLEEWRYLQTGRHRINQIRRENMFRDTKLTCNVIGAPNIIENISRQRLMDFYNDWYRPDLQAVIAVGDFDIADVEALIHKHFNNLLSPENPREKDELLIPQQDETIFFSATDQELIETRIMLISLLECPKFETIEDYRNYLVILLLNSMLKNRFFELSQKQNSPFISTNTNFYFGEFPFSIHDLITTVDESRIYEGLESIFTEIERTKQHGFYESELLRAKAIVLSELEQSYRNRFDQHSSDLTWRYISHFRVNINLISDENEFYLANDLSDYITLEDIQNALLKIFNYQNMIIGVTAPATAEGKIPSKEETLTILHNIINNELDVWQEMVLNETLLSELPRRVRVRRPKYDRQLGMYTWTLRNGARVHLKQTDFKKDEILFQGFRNGGATQASDDIFLSAVLSPRIQNLSGIGNFDKTSLDLYLTGKDLNISTSIRYVREVISGNSSVADFETFMQLIWLNFTEHRFDDVAYEIWKRNTETAVRNRTNDPLNLWRESRLRLSLIDQKFVDTEYFSLDDLYTINHQEAYDFYTDRFSSVHDFEFVFVGDISHRDLHRFIETYIATLPDDYVDSDILYRGESVNQTEIPKDFYIGFDRALISLNFPNDFEHSFREMQLIDAATSILGGMLLRYIREELGAVYLIQAGNDILLFNNPLILTEILYFCNPERMEEIEEEIFKLLENLKNNNFDERFLVSYQESFRQRLENDKGTNAYWLRTIDQLLSQNYNVNEILSVGQMVDSFTKDDISHIINKYIDFNKLVRIRLLPEGNSLE